MDLLKHLVYTKYEQNYTQIFVMIQSYHKKHTWTLFKKAYAISDIYLLHAKSTIFCTVCKHLSTQTPPSRHRETASGLRWGFFFFTGPRF